MKPFTFLLFAFHISTQALPAQQPALATDALWKQQADSLKALEDYAAAETHLLKTLTSIAQDKGKEDLDYASCLYALVEVYNQTGDLQRSESCLLEVKAIRLKKLGREHPDYAGVNFDLGLLYHKTWRYAEAEACYKEAIAIREKLPGDESTLFAASLYRLSFLYWEMGRNQEAEKALTKVLAIKEKKPGKDNAEYAIYLNQMGNVVSDQGRLEEAESFYVEARMLREKHLGKDHPYYANTTDNLGVLYTDMGRYAEAEKLLEEAKAIREKTPGKMSEAYTKSLNNLAVLYRTTGRLNEAVGAMQQVLNIKDSLSGQENPDYANSLINIGIIYRDLERYSESEQMLLKANAIWEKIFGRDNPVYAEFEVTLGSLYTETGRYEEAEKMYDQALSVLEKLMSRDNLLPAKIMRDRARLYAKTGRHELAEPLLIASDDIQKGLLSRGVRFLSEKELASYTAVFMQNSYYFLQYASTRSRSQAALIQACYDHALFSKGFLLNAVNRTKKLALSDTLTAKTYELLVLNSRLLADEYALPPAEQKGTDSLEAKVNELEKELARRVAGFSDANRQVSWQDVQQNLKPDEAALEFVHFHCYDQNSRITDSVVYAAMLLRPGWKAPRWFTLFEQQELRRLFSGPNNNTSLNHNYANNKQRSRAEGIVVGIGESAGLYQLIWKALEKETTGVKTLYYAPSGLLHRLNHAAIPINADSVLADRFRLVQVGSTRQLALRGQNLATDPAFVPSMDQPATAALFGGIRYDLDSTAIRQSPATLNAPTGTRSSQSIVFFDNNVRRTGWDYLPFTEKEVSDVEKYLKATNVEVDAFKGYEATEEAFKSIGSNKPSPRTIHLATHGFFFPDPKGASGIDESVFKSADNPMMRSGLLLAGANHAWQTGKPFRPDMDDGILTAYEISQMNLSNTELVVLSACETGLGDIQGNEGVYGLQRAFKIAGAKYLVMSLWQVPDKETSEFMAAFYRKWLEDRMEIPDAFRAAQKEMREQGLAPYQWAGFVLVE